MSEFTLPPIRNVEPETIATHLFHVKQVAPLVHCITNDVVQEIGKRVACDGRIARYGHRL